MLEFVIRPWRLVILPLRFYLSRRQQRMIEYLQTENQVLREKLNENRVPPNNDQHP